MCLQRTSECIKCSFLYIFFAYVHVCICVILILHFLYYFFVWTSSQNIYIKNTQCCGVASMNRGAPTPQKGGVLQPRWDAFWLLCECVGRIVDCTYKYSMIINCTYNTQTIHGCQRQKRLNGERVFERIVHILEQKIYKLCIHIPAVCKYSNGD